MKLAKGSTMRCHFLVVLFALIGSCYTQSSLTLSVGDVSWTNRGQQTDFKISSALGNGVNAEAAWMGVGFNAVKQMNGASVVACFRWNRGDSVQHYYNAAYKSTLLDSTNKQLGLSNLAVSYVNGRLTCTFTRDNTNPNPNYYNITSTSTPFIIFAYGTPTALGDIQTHVDREASPNAVSLAAGSTVSSSTPTPDPSGSTTTTKPAIQNGLFSSNGFTVTWKNSTSLLNATDFTVTIQALSSSNIYAAIGFSNDQAMGGDDVYACIYATNKKTVSRFYNPSGHQAPQAQPNNNGISNAVVTIANGNLQCSFTRLNRLNEPNFYDLSNKYYLLAVSGTTDDQGSLNKHSSKVVSEVPIDFLANDLITGKADDNAKTKAHGCLMVFAWMFCASIGIIIARYYKCIFPSRKLCGLQIWFVIHRPLMMFVPVVAITAFIVILADLNWKWVDTSEQLELAHSIIGIITIGFSLIQIFIAFFRCDKDHPKRFIFNYFHRSLGLLTFLLSIATMYLGVFIDKMELGNVGWAILAGWTFWVLVFPLILETLELIFASPKQSTGTSYMTNRSLLERIKSGAIILHVLIVLALTVALIVCIAIAKKGRFTPLL